MSQVGDEKNIQGWRVIRVQTSRGYAKKTGEDDAPLLPIVGLTLFCEDLPRPGEFLFHLEDAEATAHALLDTARNAREDEGE